MITTNNIDQLISTFLSGEATPEEAMFLEDWKQQSQENLAYYNSCVKIFEITSKNKTAPVVTTEIAWAKLKPQLINKVNEEADTKSYKSKSFLRIAASIIIVLGFAGIIAYLIKNKPEEHVTYTAEKTSNTVKLNDGTSVTIAPHSTLTYNSEFGKINRSVSLKGSAYFSIAHNNTTAFVIDAGKVFIKDIGTAFNVVTSANEDTVSVEVDEGLVLMFDGLGTESTVKAGEEAFYIKSTRQLLFKSRVANAIQFNFNHDKLIDVIARLNTAYNILIELENKDLENCTITTQFANENIETVLSVITETVGLSYKKTATGFVITGEKCNN